MYDEKVFRSRLNRARVLYKDRSFPGTLEPKPFPPSKFKTLTNPFPLQYLRAFTYIWEKSSTLMGFFFSKEVSGENTVH